MDSSIKNLLGVTSQYTVAIKMVPSVVVIKWLILCNKILEMELIIGEWGCLSWQSSQALKQGNQICLESLGMDSQLIFS